MPSVNNNVHPFNKAVEVLTALVRKDPTNAVNSLCNFFTSAEQAFSTKADIEPVMLALKADKRFLPIIERLTDILRHDYRHHGTSLEGCIGALFIASFISGVQFALDDFKTELPAEHPAAVASPPSLKLVN